MVVNPSPCGGAPFPSLCCHQPPARPAPPRPGALSARLNTSTQPHPHAPPHGEHEGALHLPSELWCPVTELPTRAWGTRATGRGGCRYSHHMVTWGVAALDGHQSQPIWRCTLSVPMLGGVLPLPAVWSLGGLRSLVVVDPRPIWGCTPSANRPLPPTGTWGVTGPCGRRSQNWKGARRSLG